MSVIKKQKEGKQTSLSQVFISSILQAPSHPLSYVKVLMQIGHEPMPPFRSKNLFGREQYFYPNAFSYVRYIYSVEGFTGLYRGLGMRFVSHSIATVVYNQVSIMIDDADSSSDKDDDKLNAVVRQTTKEITAKCWSVLLSHPFHVMAFRCMAQFVGGESRYSSWNIFQNIGEIYRTEGILGFFSGLVPRILFEASTIALTNAIAYVIKTYVFDEKDFDGVIELTSSLIASSVTYPLSLVSTVSTISGSAILAGQPPRMLVYASWIDVFRHLYEANELKRGSATFFRAYNAPAAGISFSKHVALSDVPKKKTQLAAA